MKKTVVLFLLSVITFTSFAQSDENVAQEKNVLKVNTLALIIGTGSIFYERKVSELVSAQMGVG